MPQRPSSPRATVGRIDVVDDAILEHNALMPGLSRIYVAASVPVMAALSATGSGTNVASIAWPLRS